MESRIWFENGDLEQDDRWVEEPRDRGASARVEGG
jgi:hypothetical protein